MARNIQSDFKRTGIHKVLFEYTQSKSVKVIKSSFDDSYVLLISGNQPNQKAREIESRLNDAGYQVIRNPLGRQSPIAHKSQRFTIKTFRGSKFHTSPIHQACIRMKVVAPTPPSRPKPFPNPNGKPPKHSHKKKG